LPDALIKRALPDHQAKPVSSRVRPALRFLKDVSMQKISLKRSGVLVYRVPVEYIIYSLDGDQAVFLTSGNLLEILAISDTLD
jgi:hypothetical protein